MSLINENDIARLLEDIPDDGDVISEYGDFDEQEIGNSMSPLDLDESLDAIQANVQIDLDSCG